jgi:two-component system sensor histidine kinase AlgZ
VTIWLAAGAGIGIVVREVFGFSWTAAFLFGLPMGLAGGPVALSAWYVLGSAVQTGAALRPMAAVLLAAAVSSALWSTLGQFWWRTLESVDLAPAVRQGPSAFVVLFSLGLTGYLLAAAAYQVREAIEATSRASRRALEADVAQRDAELRALRAQLDPHFLFNSLNSIAGLIGVEPSRAREMCQLLGEFLRESLKVGATGRIPLAREVALVEQYLRIEQVRFGARLQVVIVLADDTVGVMVPPLLLQPLVESAVRHGVATRLEGGTIEVTTRRAGARVVIVVSNPRDADARRGGTGYGLDIVGRRLAATYGEAATLTVEPAPESFRASVTVPVETM